MPNEILTKEKAAKLNGEKIAIPYGYTEIGEMAFNERTITKITIPDTVKIIGKLAFAGCKSLTEINLPTSVKIIGDWAFYNCHNLTEIIIPASVKSIGRSAFRDCLKLKSITVPDSVTEIGEFALPWGKNLTVLCSKKSLAFKYCKKNKNKTRIVYIPELITAEDLPEEIITDVRVFDISKKIKEYIIKINILNSSIGDALITKELEAIKIILDKIIIILKEEKDENDIENHSEQLDQFLSYYFPTIIKILESYSQIEKHDLDGSNALETKKRIAESMPFIRKAFEQQLDNMYKNKMLDITTDIDVLETMLAKEGLLDETPFIPFSFNI